MQNFRAIRQGVLEKKFIEEIVDDVDDNDNGRHRYHSLPTILTGYPTVGQGNLKMEKKYFFNTSTTDNNIFYVQKGFNCR